MTTCQRTVEMLKKIFEENAKVKTYGARYGI